VNYLWTILENVCKNQVLLRLSNTAKLEIRIKSICSIMEQKHAKFATATLTILLTAQNFTFSQ